MCVQLASSACAPLQGALHALRTIVAQEGVRGLWRGTTPAVQRAALVNLGELATYDQVNIHIHVLHSPASQVLVPQLESGCVARQRKSALLKSKHPDQMCYIACVVRSMACNPPVSVFPQTSGLILRGMVGGLGVNRAV